jgi:hypothetical protein
MTKLKVDRQASSLTIEGVRDKHAVCLPARDFEQELAT